jgi:DNA-binding MarR family transcriptional regulator
LGIEGRAKWLELFGFPNIGFQINSELEIRMLTSAIVSTGNALVREAGRLFKRHGISAVQFNVLNLLMGAPEGMRPTRLTEALVVDASSTTYVIDRMEALGWIKRTNDPRDRRANLIILTAAGRRMHAMASPSYFAALREMMGGLEPGHLNSLAHALAEIQAAAQKAVDAALSRKERPGKAPLPAPQGSTP